MLSLEVAGAGPEPQLAEWLTTARGPLRDMVRLLAGPGVLSLANGAPAPECMPRAALAAIAARVLASDPLSLQLAPPSLELKRELVGVMATRGVACEAEHIVLVHGGQQALDLVVRALLEPGRPVIVEDATYPGLLCALEPYRPEILRVPSHAERGMDLDAVEAVLAGGARPAFVYAMPEAHNPMGTRMPAAARARLVELARRHRVPIIEDDVAGLLPLDDAGLPALRALDDRWVFYVGSFSKLLGPALRTGWLVAPGAAIAGLTLIKDLAATDTRTLAQQVIAGFLAGGGFDAHVALARRVYRDRRDRMLAALRVELPEAEVHAPASGLFVWVRLPARCDALALLRAALADERVGFVPGPLFASDGRLTSCLRLCFAGCPAEAIEDGIARLGRAVRANLARRRTR